MGRESLDEKNGFCTIRLIVVSITVLFQGWLYAVNPDTGSCLLSGFTLVAGYILDVYVMSGKYTNPTFKKYLIIEYISCVFFIGIALLLVILIAFTVFSNTSMTAEQIIVQFNPFIFICAYLSLLPLVLHIGTCLFIFAQRLKNADCFSQ